ncbi:MAG: adenylosuccinate synthase, partial [Hymenobacter sp.]
PALRYAIMLNGVTELHLMKADVLDGFAEIQACTHYRTATGESTPNLPDPGQLETITPEYQAIPGWNTDLTQVTDAAQFPQPLQDYLAFLEKELQVPVRIVSVGPDRVSTLFR